MSTLSAGQIEKHFVIEVVYTKRSIVTELFVDAAKELQKTPRYEQTPAMHPYLILPRTRGLGLFNLERQPSDQQAARSHP